MKPQATALFKYSIALIRPSAKLAIFATLMGVVNSIAAVGLLSIIDRQIHSDDSAPSEALIAFAGLLATMLGAEIISGVGNTLVGQNAVFEVRRDLVRKILHAPIDALERAQNHRIIAALTTDINHISEFTRSLSFLIVAICETVGCAIYLVYFSWEMFLTVAATGLCTYLAIRWVSKVAYKNFSDERTAVDELQKHYRALAEGAKELRVSRRRRHRFFYEQLLETIDRIRKLTNQASIGFVVGVALELVIVFHCCWRANFAGAAF